MTFVIKALAPAVVGGGLGTGGVYVYRSVLPTTWQEYLEREGFRIIDTSEGNTSKDNDFKAIFTESEELIKSKKEDDNLKQATDISKHGKIKDYCTTKLKENTNWEEKTKNELIKLCTHSGISTVKAKIVQAGKSDWITDENNWKAAFAVNKYRSSFLSWINAGREESNKIKETDKPSSKHTDLKNKCESEWKKKHEDNKGNKAVYNNAYWWCTKLTKITVKDRINEKDATWQQETDNNKIKTAWEHTNDVKKTIRSDLSKGTEDTLDASDYKKWCDDQLKKNLYDDDIYKDKYLQIKSVCRQRPSEGK